MKKLIFILLLTGCSAQPQINPVALKQAIERQEELNKALIQANNMLSDRVGTLENKIKK